MSNSDRNVIQIPLAYDVREMDERDMQTVEGGRDVNDGCYLYYGYYCPSNELKPFTK